MAKEFLKKLLGFDQVSETFGGSYNEEVSPDFDNKNRDAVLVIDASASMLDKDWIPSRLAAAQQSAIAFVERLAGESPYSSVAIVAYGDKGKLLIPLTQVRKKNKINRAINAITCMGGTNITGGIQIALSLLRRPSGQVVLLSDGYHNTGCSPHSIADQLKKRAVVDCIGIGGFPTSVDETLLKYIASIRADGSKRYRWIGDKEQLINHFHNLAGRLSRG